MTLELYMAAMADRLHGHRSPFYAASLAYSVRGKPSFGAEWLQNLKSNQPPLNRPDRSGIWLSAVLQNSFSFWK